MHAIPHVHTNGRFLVTPGVDEFLILACDGVWEMMNTTQGWLLCLLFFRCTVQWVLRLGKKLVVGPNVG